MKPYNAFITRKELGLSIESEVILDIVRQLERSTVMAVMKTALECDLASHATIHRAIKDAIKLKFMAIKTSEKDGRVKYCSLTKKGQNYLESL